LIFPSRAGRPMPRSCCWIPSLPSFLAFKHHLSARRHFPSSCAAPCTRGLTRCRFQGRASHNLFQPGLKHASYNAYPLLRGATCLLPLRTTRRPPQRLPQVPRKMHWLPSRCCGSWA
jgi:hypothetical protein